MRLLAGLASLALLLLVLRDAFETIILPRRVRRQSLLTTFFYGASWRSWRSVALHLPGSLRENSLSWFGPFSLLVLLAVWAFGIVLAFAGMHWWAGSALTMRGTPGFLDDLYLSGTTFFTLGMGDVVPRVGVAKVITVLESGVGFAFLAVVIGYLPVIYQAFSRREINISLLDARAGSPPSAGELLLRLDSSVREEELSRLLAEWERWSAEVLESHLSYPVLAYFRSQHSNQSWLAALTTILDTSALTIVGFEDWCARQARLTFAIARHAVVDLAQVFATHQPVGLPDRLPDAEFAELAKRLDGAGIRFSRPDAQAELAHLRSLYEPYVAALSQYLSLRLPEWRHPPDHKDNWQAAPWDPPVPHQRPPEHF